MLPIINLSYIIATHNRFTFLKITLDRLINKIQPGEEIVVVDGDSTDGSKEYLQQLFEQRKIHQFVSEPDRNQAHAWNKAMLMAKGIVIKKIIDDDVFCYDAIRKCKQFMLQNPRVDLIISNDLSSTLNNYKEIQKHSRLPQFQNWAGGATPSFTFGDVHMLIRKSSLAFIGLYNTDFVMMDWEYSLRVSYLKANIAYYTGYNALSVAHPDTTTSKKNERLIKSQGQSVSCLYEYKGDDAAISIWSKIKIRGGRLLSRTKKASNFQAAPPAIGEVYQFYYDYLSEINGDNEFQFIQRT